jgi:hypothetical protein
VEVFFRTRQLQRLCSEEREMKKRLGQKMAGKLKQRLNSRTRARAEEG